MRPLPAPATIEDNEDVKVAFHLAFFQGEDQAKAIIKGDLAHSAETQYLNFIGPYWTSVIYGLFTPTQLEIQTHKLSDSIDFIESMRTSRKLAQMPICHKLYLLGTAESNVKLEDIIQSTDTAVKLLIDTANAHKCESIRYCYTPSPIKQLDRGYLSYVYILVLMHQQNQRLKISPYNRFTNAANK